MPTKNDVATGRVYGPGPTPSSRVLLAVPGDIITSVDITDAEPSPVSRKKRRSTATSINDDSE